MSSRGKREDLTGQIFGRLTVVGFAHSDHHKQRFWHCLCSCGNSRVIRTACLYRGSSTSCGCYRREITGSNKTTHGLRRTPEYRVWSGVIQRCTNPKNPKYPSYGGRGIYVCSSWLQDFAEFYKDMGPRPSAEHTLDRKDNDGPYCKDNCRWATRIEQSNNTRSNLVLCYEGVYLTLSQWARVLNLPYKTLHTRISQGWTVEETFQTPCTRRVAGPLILDYNGESLTVKQWAERLGMPHGVLQNRLSMGWDVERALTQPAKTRSRR